MLGINNNTKDSESFEVNGQWYMVTFDVNDGYIESVRLAEYSERFNKYVGVGEDILVDMDEAVVDNLYGQVERVYEDYQPLPRHVYWAQMQEISDSMFLYGR